MKKKKKKASEHAGSTSKCTSLSFIYSFVYPTHIFLSTYYVLDPVHGTRAYGSI